MVSTRGAQPATPSISLPVDEKQMAQSAYQDGSIPPSSSSLGKARKNGAETIGSRLRKRRRTGSSPIEGTPPTSKQTHSRQTPDAKRGLAVSSTQASQRTRARAQNTPKNTAPAPNAAFDGLSHIQNATAADPSPAEATAPDFNAIIANIINHGETVDNHHASSGYDQMGMVDTASLLPQGASVHLKTQSLPILDNLATQILNLLAQSSYQEILTIATKPNSDPGHAYHTLKSLFNHTKKVYSAQEPFLSPHELGLSENAHIDTIRKANMATFVSSVFGSQDVGFYHLNEFFLDTFVADGNRILKTQAQLYLDLKTQAYISAASNGERSREETLEDLFPSDLEQRLLSRRPGAKQLAPSELDFVQRAQNRRKALIEEPNTDESRVALPEKYIWEDFLRDIATYVTKNFDAIAGDPPRKTSRSNRASNMLTGHQKQQHQVQRRRQTLHGQQVLSNDQNEPMQSSNEASNTQPASALTTSDDIAEKAARAAHFAMEDYGDNPGNMLPPQPPAHTPRRNKRTQALPSQSQTPIQSQQAIQTEQPQIQYHFENQLHPNVPAPPPPYFQHIPYQHPQMQNQWHSQLNGLGPFHPSYNEQNLIPYPTQSAPTQVLYERARMAASSKASPSSRRAGHPSQRRPWTADEENSLMAGLDRVKGPHWSQILAMFGPGGTINEVLKDRNQVQLKDKARNLKLFFLKSNIEVPYYLQFVTGELKTRAPAQAAKNEAKEKGISEEDRAHVEGVMALAGGSLQDGDQANPDLAEGEGDEIQSGHLIPAPDENNSNIDPSLEAGMVTAIDTHTGNETVVGMAPGTHNNSGTGSIAPTAEMLMRRVEEFSMPQTSKTSKHEPGSLISGNSHQDGNAGIGHM